MKTELWLIGKTNERYLDEGMALYDKRLRHYLPFGSVILQDIKNNKLDPTRRKQAEAELVLKRLKPEDLLVLLDERGQQHSSCDLAKQLERWLSAPKQRLVFLVGGAFGVDPRVMARADVRLSLSKATFSHQMVRLIFLEQLYRAMTILRGEPYHNE